MAGGVSHTIGVLVRGHNALTSALVQAEGSLASFRKTAEATALKVNRAFAKPPDIDTKAIDEAKGNLTSAGTAAMVAGGVMAAGLGLAVREAVTFEMAMTHVSTLVDTSTTDMNRLTGSVRSLSREIGTAPAETAKTLAAIIKGGFREAGTATLVLEGSMRLAEASFSDMTETASSLTAIMNAYGVAAGQVTSVSDQLITAANMGRTSVAEFADSMRKVTPLAARAGVGLDELLAATSALSGVMHVSEAVGSLRGVLAALNDPGKEASETAQALGINFSAAAVKTMGLANWLADVKEKTGGSEEALTKLFGPVKVLQGVFALTGSQAEQYAGILDKVKNSAGATAVAFEKVNATAGDALGDAKANLQDLLITLGNVLLPAVGKLAGLIKDAAGAMSSFAEAHPLLTQVGVTLTVVTAGVLLLGGAVLIVAGQLVAAMAAVNISTGGILIAIGAVVVGITALVTYFSTGTDRMAGASEALSTAWLYMKKGFYAAATPIAYGLGFLVGTLTVAWDTVAAYTAEVWPMVRKVVLGEWSGIATVLIPQVAFLTALFTYSWEMIKVSTRAAWELIKLTATTAWNMTVNVIKLGWTLVSGLFKAGLQILTGDWSGAWETIKTMLGSAWENIKAIFGTYTGWLTGLGKIFYDAGSGFIDALLAGVMAGWGRLKDGVTKVVGEIRALLPGSDAEEGPLSDLTAAGRALMPTFARGISQTAGTPVLAVKASLEEMPLTLPPLPSPSLPAVVTSQPTSGFRSEERGSERSGVVFERGAFVITVNGQTALDDLEDRLTEIFSRAATRMGTSYA